MKFIEVNEKDVSTGQMQVLFTVISLLFTLAGIGYSLMNNSLGSLYRGYLVILQSPTILLTDFIYISGIGPAMFNVGIVGLYNLLLIRHYKLKFNGVLIASFMTVIGFSFFGKNLFNILPIYLGGYLYTRYQNISYKDVIVVMMFGTALAPIISELSFAGIFIQPYGIIVGLVAGVFIGFIIVPLSSHMLRFHEGYNLYNIGFTSGIIGTFLTSLLRSLGVEVKPVNLVSSSNEHLIIVTTLVVFIIFILYGLSINRYALKNFMGIFQYKGRLITDFTYLTGYGITFLNIGLLGLFALGYVVAVGGVVNGPTLAGIFTLAGFGAFGKHFKNIIPVMAGVVVTALLLNYDLSSTAIVISVLFSTTLAPIAGSYGPLAGFIAGMCHMILVTNVGVIHGGINLYNNGFSGGIVAGILIPVIDAFRKE